MNRLLPLTLAALCLTTPASAQITAFQHIIVVIQENRTPDNLFQGLCPPANPSACSTQPSSGQYNIQTAAWSDKTSSTGATNPKAVPLGVGYDIGHSHYAFVAMCDPKNGACQMDGAANEPCTRKSQKCPAKAAFGFVDNSKGAVQPYLDLVHNYGWANYMFQTNQGPSFPAHQFLFGATSAPSAVDDAKGIFAVGNTPKVGCDAPSTARVWLINPAGELFRRVYPCFERATLTDLLDGIGVSWRYYGVAPDTWPDPGPVGIWTAPNAIKHICVASNGVCTGTEWTSHVTFTQAAVLSDIANCNLSGVSWVIPDAFDSDHMDNVQNIGGPSWVASIVTAIQNSPCTNTSDGSSYWNSTAIVVLWDDWGGWFDHVAPTIEAYPQGGYQMGFRVPLIVVSAYTPAGTISNSPEDFGSVIRFIEHNFGITEGMLTFADRRGTGDLNEFFQFSSPPHRPKTIKAPLSAKYFLTRKPSGLPVDDD